MPTLYTSYVIWGFPFNDINLELQRRLGVAIFSEGNPDHVPFTPYTGPQRLAVVNPFTPYGTAANHIGASDPQLDNFQSIYSTSLDGSTKDFYIGNAAMTANYWARLQSRVAFAPVGTKYFKASLNAQDEWIGVETNIPVLEAWIGLVTPVEGEELITQAGLVRYNSGVEGRPRNP